MRGLGFGCWWGVFSPVARNRVPGWKRSPYQPGGGPERGTSSREGCNEPLPSGCSLSLRAARTALASVTDVVRALRGRRNRARGFRDVNRGVRAPKVVDRRVCTCARVRHFLLPCGPIFLYKYKQSLTCKRTFELGELFGWYFFSFDSSVA